MHALDKGLVFGRLNLGRRARRATRGHATPGGHARNGVYDVGADYPLRRGWSSMRVSIDVIHTETVFRFGAWPGD